MAFLKHLFLLACLCCSLISKAQGFYIHKENRVIIKNSGTLYIFDSVFNGLTLRSLKPVNWDDILVVAGNYQTGFDSFTPSVDEHFDGFQSNLLMFKNHTFFSIISKSDVDLELVFQFVSDVHLPIFQDNQKRNSCELPLGIIPQSVWRQGLNNPKPGRNATKTQHCIIHHSAGGNGNTNYTQLVRSYYVQHTEVNGWDDIGYNYLIANDGSIFAGRDPLVNTISQDQVLGAHFCAKNISTMGVCLIGDYDTLQPNSKMIEVLVDLLSWKYAKDTLNPLSKFAHPTENDPLLNALSGHRQGCATICPGNQVFNQLSDIRNQTYSRYIQCLPFVGISETHFKINFFYSPNPSQNTIYLNSEYLEEISKVSIIQMNGQIFLPEKINEINLNKGIYIIKVEMKNGFVFYEKILID